MTQKYSSYDYTKVYNRINTPAKRERLKELGMHLTFSHTGTNHDESNDKDVASHLETGNKHDEHDRPNVAAVFRSRDKAELPHTFVVHHHHGSDVRSIAYPVHDANQRDDRSNDTYHHPIGSNAPHEEYLKNNPSTERGHGMISGLTFKGNTNKELEKTEFANDIGDDGVSHIHIHH